MDPRTKERTTGAAQSGNGADGGKHLTFRLGRETYGIEVLGVQEIIRMTEITRVPRAPRFVRGVINLRGRITPVVDLRERFALGAAGDTERTCIVVVEPRGESVAMGLVVDEVLDVCDLAAEQIEPPPSFGREGAPRVLAGMAKVGEQVVLLLDIDRILSAEESDLVALSAISSREPDELVH